MENAFINIDSIQSEPEKWPQDDPMMPSFGVTVFFQSKEDAQDFIDAAWKATASD